MLLRAFLEILRDWQAAFPRQRSYRRAVAQALGTLTALGRRTLSRCHLGAGPCTTGLECRLQAACPCPLADGGTVSTHPGSRAALVPRPLRECGH
jgi:hypothetical protein